MNTTMKHCVSAIAFALAFGVAMPVAADKVYERCLTRAQSAYDSCMSRAEKKPNEAAQTLAEVQCLKGTAENSCRTERNVREAEANSERD